METKWRNIGEAIGLSAVVVSVALLGLELNHANRLAEEIESREVLQLYNNLSLTVASDPDFAAFMAKLASEDEIELTDTEHERAVGLAWWLRNVWVSVRRAHSLDIVPEVLYQGMLEDIRINAELYPKLRPYMRMTSEAYQGVAQYELDRVIMEVTAD